MTQKFSNGAKMLLATSCLAVDTSIQVQAAYADRFPIANTSSWGTTLDWFRATIQDSTGAFEIIKVGVRASGSAVLSNILRGQEGTTALPWAVGAYIQHAPTAADYEQALSGLFAQFTATNGTAAAAWYMKAGILTLAQAAGDGTLGTDRFTFDQTNGLLTATDLALTSDERLKTGWKGMGRTFLQKLADVKRGTYRRKDGGRREVGVSAQSLREVLPQAVHHSPADGMLTVSYGQAALVAAIELAADNGLLRAQLVDIEQRVKKLERAA